MNQKLILTLWKVELYNRPQTESFGGLFCNIKYSSQTFQSRKCAYKELIWKQTFVFRSDNKFPKVEIEFLSFRDHNQQQQGLTMNNKYFGKSLLAIKYNSSQKTLAPRYIDVINQSGKLIGKVELSYQIYHPQQKYKQYALNYKYSITISEIQLTFKRILAQKSFMYLKIYIGDEFKQETIPFQPIEEDSLKFYINNQENINFQIVTEKTKDISNMFELLGKANQYTELSQRGKSQKKTLNINSSIVYSILNLKYTQNKQSVIKLPIRIPPFIDVGTIKFKINVVFKETIKQTHLLPENNKISKKEVKLSRNGILIIFPLKIKFDDLTFRNRLLRIQIKLGHQIIEKNIELETHQYVFLENIKFKRVWEQNFEIIIYENQQNTSIRWLCSAKTNLREVFELKTQLKRSCRLFDMYEEEVGEVTLNLQYSENEFFSKKLKQKQKQEEFDVIDNKAKLLQLKLEKQISRSFSRKPSKKSSSKYSREGSFSSSKSHQFPSSSKDIVNYQYSLMIRNKDKRNDSLKKSGRISPNGQLNLESSYDANIKGISTYRSRIQSVRNRVGIKFPSLKHNESKG